MIFEPVFAVLYSVQETNAPVVLPPSFQQPPFQANATAEELEIQILIVEAHSVISRVP